jgi:uncharacterized cupin superfamily protein
MSKVIRPNNTQLKAKDSPITKYSWMTSDDLGKSLNLKDFFCNIRSLKKGKFSYPYHFHHNAEELFVVISGKGELRTPQGIQVIDTGEIALFEKGESGAHQIFNPNPEPLVYLDLRTLNKIDVCEYPDTGKVKILPQQEIFYKGDTVDYFKGEQNIKEIWTKLANSE